MLDLVGEVFSQDLTKILAVTVMILAAGGLLWVWKLSPSRRSNGNGEALKDLIARVGKVERQLSDIAAIAKGFEHGLDESHVTLTRLGREISFLKGQLTILLKNFEPRSDQTPDPDRR